MICEHCGEDLTGKGLIYNIEHAYSHRRVEYRVPTDDEMREAFLELGMPKIAFTAMGYAQPTETERKIYEDNSRFNA